jgi:hypothetical protein
MSVRCETLVSVSKLCGHLQAKFRDPITKSQLEHAMEDLFPTETLCLSPYKIVRDLQFVVVCD